MKRLAKESQAALARAGAVAQASAAAKASSAYAHAVGATAAGEGLEPGARAAAGRGPSRSSARRLCGGAGRLVLLSGAAR